jgi:hypothetical protein
MRYGHQYAVPTVGSHGYVMTVGSSILGLMYIMVLSLISFSQSSQMLFQFLY